MSSKKVKLAIVFADISGSTRLFEVLGDTAARTIVSETLDLLTKCIDQYQGTVIKTIGDEIMCTFPVLTNAVQAVTEMQLSLDETNKVKNPDTEVNIRIGIHYGDAILENNDVFGDAVNVAARMAAQAKGGQIISTKSTVDLFDSTMRDTARFVDRLPIKGKKDEMEIFEIIWQEDDVTRMAASVVNKTVHDTATELHITYKDKKITLDENRAAVVIGRSVTCDLPINESLASRQHVRIERRRNKFFIIDQSTNGTHIKMDNDDNAFLRREEMVINGNGQISLGKAFSEGPTETVAFVLET